ncbi:hypothetical protein VST7929_01103 [Vibrio stylophorae]|uniref:Lipoprotein n=1 Tax=Vibrio stylophorae TaxID=659351 RepID=A0ABN8DSM4_9VIBR|nr:hypothetical protein [Vibrio stylophorae]CAH0533239.1 hypothetical protein VST7929_01103 [Vibrio stylophorae]
MKVIPIKMMQTKAMSLKTCLISLLLAMTLTGCGTTSALWENDRYFESVSSFTVNDNNNLLIVSGNKYAYLFEISPALKTALKLSRDIEFTPRISPFVLQASGEITGELTLFIHASRISEARRKQLIDLGFSDTQPMQFHASLTGHRLALEGQTNSIKLENEYRIQVIQESSTIANLGKVIITPATVVIDSAIVVTTVIPTAVLYGVLGVYMYAGQP